MPIKFRLKLDLMVLVINNKSGESQSQWSTFYLNYQALMTLQIFFMSNLLSPLEAVLYNAVFVLISPGQYF